MTVRDIIQGWLRDNGFDGLFNPGECACLIADLMPCEDYIARCEPGYKGRCDLNDPNACEWCVEEGGFHVSDTREWTPNAGGR